MKDTAEKLIEIVEMALPLLFGIDDESASKPRAEGKWAPKEVIGHLIDSASNNHQKFVRTMEAKHVDFPRYAQEHWVNSQDYRSRDWGDLIRFWEGYNRHLAHVIAGTPPDLLSNTITIEGTGPFTLEFIMNDYVEHLKHHLLQIAGDVPFSSNFANVYNA